MTTNFLAGQRLTADALNKAIQKILARGPRTTAGTATTTTAQGFVRLDDKAILAGHRIRVFATGLHPQSTVAADAIQVDFYYTTDGSTPTTSSAILDGSEFFCRPTSANSAETNTIAAGYTPVSDETLSVLVAYKRIAGSGNVNLFGSADAQFELIIEDLGTDPGATGTNL